MAVSSLVAASGGKTRYVVTLTSGTSWTVPAGVTYVNATLIGAGGGGASYTGSGYVAVEATSGQEITTNVATTPGASIAYSIGAGGTGGTGAGSNDGGVGGTTTFTGATSATGGGGGKYFGSGTSGRAGRDGRTSGNFGQMTTGATGGVGGSGSIELEYWV